MTSISLFDPVREGVSLREALNRLFEDSVVPSSRNGDVRGMLLDVVENKDDIVVKASLPGTDKEKVEIHFQGDTLTLKATIGNGQLAEGSRYLLHERFAGQVARSITLPVAVDADKAAASYQDGVLTLTLPKSESVKPRTIKVN